MNIPEKRKIPGEDMIHTRIKLCGMMQAQDIECANELMPDLVGFVFAKESRRYVTKDQAVKLKDMLAPGISAAGVFVDEDISNIKDLVDCNVIDVVQLHGNEDKDYIGRLRVAVGTGKDTERSGILIIKAFKTVNERDIDAANASTADMVLLDSGKGSGSVFDWELIRGIKRDYFLAGGLDCTNAVNAIHRLSPYGVDVSSGIETDGVKDPVKMREFVEKVRGARKTGSHKD